MVCSKAGRDPGGGAMWGGESREDEGQGPGIRVSLGLQEWVGRGRQVMSRWPAMGAESGSRPGDAGSTSGLGDLRPA